VTGSSDQQIFAAMTMIPKRKGNEIKKIFPNDFIMLNVILLAQAYQKLEWIFAVDYDF
jgi:hypothetical protein